MTHDRTTPKSTHPDVPDSGLSDDLRSFLTNSAPVKQPRTRNLRATFRSAPGDSTGFPGTKAFAAYRPDRRAAGASVAPARAGEHHAPAAPAGADNPAGRRAAVLEARGSTAADQSAQPAAASPGGGRVRGRRGAGKEESAPAGKATRRAVALPREIGKLVPKEETKAPPKIIPTETERNDARRLFREIGERFNQNRKKSKTAAYAAYRHDLMANLDTLIMGGALDLKEATTIITNLEQYTRETEAESTETPATILGRWLRMDAAELAELETKVVKESVEDEENSEEEEESEELAPIE